MKISNKSREEEYCLGGNKAKNDSLKGQIEMIPRDSINTTKTAPFKTRRNDFINN